MKNGRLSGNPPGPTLVCVCVCLRDSCCCDQSQFNRQRLKVNLRGAMKADRWGLTAVSPTYIKDADSSGGFSGRRALFKKNKETRREGEQDSSRDERWPRGWIPKGHEYWKGFHLRFGLNGAEIQDDVGCRRIICLTKTLDSGEFALRKPLKTSFLLK